MSNPPLHPSSSTLQCRPLLLIFTTSSARSEQAVFPEYRSTFHPVRENRTLVDARKDWPKPIGIGGYGYGGSRESRNPAGGGGYPHHPKQNAGTVKPPASRYPLPSPKAARAHDLGARADGGSGNGEVKGNDRTEWKVDDSGRKEVHLLRARLDDEQHRVSTLSTKQQKQCLPQTPSSDIFPQDKCLEPQRSKRMAGRFQARLRLSLGQWHGAESAGGLAERANRALDRKSLGGRSASPVASATSSGRRNSTTFISAFASSSAGPSNFDDSSQTKSNLLPVNSPIVPSASSSNSNDDPDTIRCICGDTNDDGLVYRMRRLRQMGSWCLFRNRDEGQGKLT
ncbi:hypothetical protein BT96DRAFT_1024689 [Gymnopus androsaceus JB14]|uniref:Uncharacterized protein n=1 Tax=Gymnopus androsaceus JB14 TaxID=1447944 RepID=A0A6A4GXH4_9AGAR|nr:hypothetical protein BT96DRAFT_1024689 [Gymnopus androsaceus JB14]